MPGRDVVQQWRIQGLALGEEQKKQWLTLSVSRFGNPDFNFHFNSSIFQMETRDLFLQRASPRVFKGFFFFSPFSFPLPSSPWWYLYSQIFWAWLLFGTLESPLTAKSSDQTGWMIQWTQSDLILASCERQPAVN